MYLKSNFSFSIIYFSCVDKDLMCEELKMLWLFIICVQPDMDQECLYQQHCCNNSIHPVIMIL